MRGRVQRLALVPQRKRVELWKRRSLASGLQVSGVISPEEDATAARRSYRSIGRGRDSARSQAGFLVFLGRLLRSDSGRPQDDHRTTAGLLTRAVGSKVCPPHLAASQRWFSSSSPSAQSASPCSASARSSSAPLLANRSRSQRFGSGWRTTISATRSPGVSAKGVSGLSRPSS